MFDEVYLTGFKKFGNVQVNPTELIVDAFLKETLQNVKVNKLDVTTEEVDKYILGIKDQQSSSKNRILNIHCGVGPNKVYHLQNCAYNNKDFGIPDNNGNVYKSQKICPLFELDQSLKTSLNLEQLSSQLITNHKNQISTNPGRYLCNYVYFSSLNDLKCKNQHIDCLFLHIPPLNVTTHEENLAFVKDLIKIVLKSNPVVEQTNNHLKKQNQQIKQ